MITEGQEYQIILLPLNKVMYSGIAESDNETEEKLETMALYIRSALNVTYPVQLVVRAL